MVKEELIHSIRQSIKCDRTSAENKILLQEILDEFIKNNDNSDDSNNDNKKNKNIELAIRIVELFKVATSLIGSG